MAAVDAKIRAFAAVELDDRVRDAIAALIRRLKPIPARISWVRPENLHLTLRFLGDVDSRMCERFARHVQEEVATLPVFEASVRGLGAFPNARRPSVIWVGVENAGEMLAQLNAIAERAAQTIGLATETRAFVSHITLGRVRREASRSDLSEYLDAEKSFDAGAFAVEAVSLFSSELTPHGARYTRLHRLTLDGLRGARDL